MAKKTKKTNQTKKKPTVNKDTVVKTEAKYLPISARKLRLVVKAAKQVGPQEAMKKLKFMNKKGAKFLHKAIKTALADAEHNFGLDKDNLIFDEILVNEGPTLKRRDKSHGARFHPGMLRKRRSHLVVKVKEK
jgi:large subunit ribosomal protein L22